MRKALIGAVAGLGAALLLALGPAGAALAAPQPPVELVPPAIVADGAFAVATSPDGALIYVYSVYDGELSILDTATNTPAAPPVSATIELSLLNPTMLVHPDGRIFILDPGDSGAVDPAVIEVDPATWTTTRHSLALPAPAAVGWALSMAMTPAGDKLYVSDLVNGVVIAVEVPDEAGIGGWSITPIDVSGETGTLPGSLAIGGGLLYAADATGETAGGPARIAVIRTADDGLEPDLIEYTAPAGTIDGILDFPTLAADPAGTTVLLIASAEIDDGSGDYGGYLWSIPAGTVPATPTYLGASPGGEVAAATVAPGGATAYLLDCACASTAWTLSVANAAWTELDLSGATDLELLVSMAITPDGTRLLLGGYNDLGDSLLWQLTTVAHDTLLVTGPTTVEQGGSATLGALGADNSGNPIDLTRLVDYTSSVDTDTFDGNVVTFPHASPHTITASYAPVGLPPVATGALTIEVTPVLPPTGVDAAAPALLASGLLLGGGLLLALRRRRAAA